MVFESVVANLLNAYLGHFIDDVNASQLQLGAWKGNVELKNLAIKEDAFASLDLPFKILHGHVGKLTAIIPWSSLYSSPVQLSLQDVFVVAVPNVLEEYDDDIEAERAWQAKKKQLNLIEATKRNLDIKSDQKRKNLNEVAQEDDGFVTKLAAQVIRNVQILVKNIHIVYEDKFTDSANPFQVGLTLDKIVFQTVDDLSSARRTDKYSEEQKNELIFKVTSIDYLSIYFNCEKKIQFLSELHNETEIDAILSKRISSTVNQVNDPNMDFVLKPVTFRGNLVVNSKPEKFEFALPVADIDMILGDFTINLKKSQLHAITSFMDSLGRIKIAAAFRKFRPSVGVHKHSSEWWQFALSSILERDIKPRRNNWNWKRIKKHRKMCREYKEIYKEKLLCQNPSEKVEIEEELEDFERELDIFNIILCRSQAEIEVQPELEKRKQDNAKKGGGWFSLSGWGFGGWYAPSAEQEKEAEEIVKEIKQEMTPDEKTKLYDAIGYDESSVGVLDTPKDFVGLIFNFRMDSVRCIVTGFDENFKVGEFCMRNIKFSVNVRPAASAAKVMATFDSTVISTSNEDPSLKSSSLDSRRRALAFARSASKASDTPKTDFGLFLESKSFNFECSYDPKPEGVTMNMNSAVEDIKITLTHYTSYPNKLPTEEKYCILSPCTIRMISQTQSDNQVMHVEFSKLEVHMAPQALKIITTVMNAFRGSTEVRTIEKAPPKSSEILQPKLLSRDSRFRAKDIVDQALEVTEEMNVALQAAAKTLVASAPFDTSGNNHREVYLDMRNINFVVEAGIVNPQPLIEFHSSIFGQLQNANFIKLECQSILNYYNEKKSAWEPMIEPVSFDPYPSGEPVLWKFDMVIDMKEINGQSVMNIDVESQEQLDITITRTAVNVLLSLLDSLSEENDRQEPPPRPIAPIKTTKSDVHIFKNLLPFCINYNIIGKDEVHELEAGEESIMEGIRFGKTEIRIKLIDYLGCSWVADSTIEGVTEDEEFESWKFYPASNSKPAGHSLDPIPYNPGHRRTDSYDEYTLTVLLDTRRDAKGHVTSTLFSPYWLINKTQLPLNWKLSGRRGYNVIDPGDINYPVLMSFKQSLFSKKKMKIKILDSELSEEFPIDVVGSKGTVLVKGKSCTIYPLAVHITMSRIGFTKIITAHPFYLIVNKTKHTIEYSEDNDEFKSAASKETVPLWPYHLKDLRLCFRFADRPDVSSKSVSLGSSNSCLLSVYDRLLYVTVEVEESGVQVTLEDYFDGCSPILFVNGTEDCMISYGQSGCKSRSRLPPMHSAHFTWHDPLGDRTVKWAINEGPEQKLNPGQDSIQMTKNNDTCWVSFVDGRQRILFVTHNFALASDMMHAIELVQPQMDITLQFKGFGLSLVDDYSGLEIAYVAIAPSDLIWEVKRPDRRHYHPLPYKDIEALEGAYRKQYARLQARSAAGYAPKIDSKTKTVSKVGKKLKVGWPNSLETLDYPTLLEPAESSGQLRRVKDRGVWGYIGYSEHVTQLHFKLSHMQIDNQTSDCLFSTLMSHIMAPKGVLGADQTPKPFFEFSSIIQRQANQQRFKYLSLLIQEFFIKIEYSFIQHLMEFSNEASTWYYRNYTHKEMIETDLDLVLNSHRALVESMTRSSSIMYDLIHFSPIKLNVSFSMSTMGKDDDKEEGVSLPLGLDFVVRSAGVTLTEFQDVTFRLDCFERTMALFTQEQLLWASLDHYKRQILKQFYVVVLGLDVIGNPVSLAMDIKQGIGDFFYEPINGMIKGPEEAVEGLAVGVASLFSHTVGGAIGALSKISGTLGEGISSLTFDDDHKRRRRQRLREQPNIARSGKDLVEGVVGGITGLVTQPVSGAKEDGFEGFMKGVGKGVIGVVTQPATSIVDFATGTLNAIKVCVNEPKGPKRLRPPRVIHIDRPLAAYNRFEAEKLLNQAKKKEKSLFF